MSSTAERPPTPRSRCASSDLREMPLTRKAEGGLLSVGSRMCLPPGVTRVSSRGDSGTLAGGAPARDEKSGACMLERRQHRWRWGGGSLEHLRRWLGAQWAELHRAARRALRRHRSRSRALPRKRSRALALCPVRRRERPPVAESVTHAHSLHHTGSQPLLHAAVRAPPSGGRACGRAPPSPGR